MENTLTIQNTFSLGDNGVILYGEVTGELRIGMCGMVQGKEIIIQALEHKNKKVEMVSDSTKAGVQVSGIIRQDVIICDKYEFKDEE